MGFADAARFGADDSWRMVRRRFVMSALARTGEEPSVNRRWIVISTLLAVIVGAASGLASAAFLVMLDRATDLQTDQGWLLYLLPLAGVVIAWAYNGYGASASGGNNLLLDQIHATDQVNRVPLRMFPLVLASTILTHLCGGSAGREGTAVQMGGALGSWLARTLRLDSVHLRLLLLCGIAGGFSSVFGTPLAGTIFAMEVLAIGGMNYDALIPCLIAAVTGDLVIDALDVHHGLYVISSAMPDLTLRTLAMVVIAGIAFGLASLVFSELTGFVEKTSKQFIANSMLRAFIGGLLVIGITLVLGTRIYNGLSLPLLSDSFTDASIPTWAFLFKIILTSVTLGVGFKGGEVTPLFVIGATLGVTLSGPLNMSPDVLAGLGFVAVFAAAANTPVACVIMAAELFGTAGVLYFGIAIFVAYTISGHRGIYHSQRVLSPKYLHRASATPGSTLRELATTRDSLRKQLRNRRNRSGS